MAADAAALPALLAAATASRMRSCCATATARAEGVCV
jgi:hypothetical protein